MHVFELVKHRIQQNRLKILRFENISKNIQKSAVQEGKNNILREERRKNLMHLLTEKE